MEEINIVIKLVIEGDLLSDYEGFRSVGHSGSLICASRADPYILIRGSFACPGKRERGEEKPVRRRWKWAKSGGCGCGGSVIPKSSSSSSSLGRHRVS